MRYVHLEEARNEPKHSLAATGRTLYGLTWATATTGKSLAAWTLAHRLRSSPNDVDIVFEAIYFIKESMAEPINIPVNHYNAETIRELMIELNREAGHEPRRRSVDDIVSFLAPDDKAQRDDLAPKSYSWRLTKYGIDNLCGSVDSIVNMLCTISALTKLLQK